MILNVEAAMEKTLTDERILYSICTSDELMQSFFKDIARKLREERCRQDMEVSMLSSLAGVSESVIYRYERGANQISFAVFIKVALALKLDIAKVISINISQQEEKVGEKFSYMVRNQSRESVDMILEVIANMIDFCQIEKGIKK